MGLRISDEMKTRASEEVNRRDPYIVHHFEIDHYGPFERDVIGFLGEFAACGAFGVEWSSNIRKDYLTIDSHDLIFSWGRVDIKTETVPSNYLERVVSRTIAENELWGKRLYNYGQRQLLSKYAWIVFGAIERLPLEEIDLWYPIGVIAASKVSSYPYCTEGPVRSNGQRIHYPFCAFHVSTTDLMPLDRFLRTGE